MHVKPGVKVAEASMTQKFLAPEAMLILCSGRGATRPHRVQAMADQLPLATQVDGVSGARRQSTRRDMLLADIGAPEP